MQALDRFALARWASSFDDLGREIMRLALLCDIGTVDPDTVDRVIRRDELVCGRRNPVAFTKLHGLLMMYFALRKKSGEALGQAQSSALEIYVLEGLRASFPCVTFAWPPGGGGTVAVRERPFSTQVSSRPAQATEPAPSPCGARAMPTKS